MRHPADSATGRAFPRSRSVLTGRRSHSCRARNARTTGTGRLWRAIATPAAGASRDSRCGCERPRARSRWTGCTRRGLNPPAQAAASATRHAVARPLRLHPRCPPRGRATHRHARLGRGQLRDLAPSLRPEGVSGAGRRPWHRGVRRPGSWRPAGAGAWNRALSQAMRCDRRRL